VKQLSDKEYLGLKTLEKRLRGVFNRYRAPGTFEDFFQTYNLEYRAGKHHHQRLDHFAIDYIREKLGRTGKKADSNLVLSGIEELSSGEDNYKHSLIDLRREIDQLKGRQKVIAGLVLIHGLSNDEISFLMDVEPSRISHIVNDIVNKVRTSATWPEDRVLSLSEIEHAAKILGVPTLWLRQKLDEVH
jgi:hypothetical protein